MVDQLPVCLQFLAGHSSWNTVNGLQFNSTSGQIIQFALYRRRRHCPLISLCCKPTTIEVYLYIVLHAVQSGNNWIFLIQLFQNWTSMYTDFRMSPSFLASRHCPHHSIEDIQPCLLNVRVFVHVMTSLPFKFLFLLHGKPSAMVILVCFAKFREKFGNS